MSGTTPNIGLNVPDHGDQNWDVPVNQNWNTLDTAIAGKQATLVSGTNIKTINNNSILGSGNIDIDALPSQTGQNGKFLATNGTNASWANVPTRNIGESVESTIPLTDAGLHLLDGSVISGSGAYSAFVTHIAGLVSGHSELFTTEANWQTSNDNYGACDKFVYDSVNNTVRLPKRVIDHGVLIKSYSAGTDWYRIYSDGWCEQGGILFTPSASNTSFTVNLHKPMVNTNYEVLLGVGDNTANNNVYLFYFDKTTTTVKLYVNQTSGGYTVGECWMVCGYTDISDLQQTPVYEYIVIANTVKTPVEVDIDEVMTDLNGKVDIADLAECSVVVETYRNGASWYRVWSDGWCEQGGMLTGLSGWQTTLVTFLKPFSNLDYNITACHTRRTGSAYNDYSATGVINPTMTGMSLNYYGTDTTGTIWWQACGYIR